ncbi:MAG: tripartite tricarboxylate transporter substrate-binding protein [Beijerinckiaceae bacterium]
MLWKMATCAFALSGGLAMAQSPYPAKPINMLVPFAAGGASDTIARLVGKSMSETLGQQIIIENVAGAGGTAGAARLAKAEPDGYTLLVHHLAITASASLYANLPYKADTAFTPLGLINSGPYVVTARMGFEANTVQEMLAKIKSSGGKVTMAHSGIGAGSHLCATLMSQAIGAEVTQIPYRGAAQSAQDIIAGNVDLLCEQTVTALPHIETKKVKAFAVTSLTPVAQLPGVPTLDSAGIKGFDLTNWHGLYAPKGTPADVVQKLNAALQKAMSDSEIQKRFVDLGTDLYPVAERTPAAHATKFDAEMKRWAEVIQKAGIKPQ